MNKRLYVQNTETSDTVEYAWSNATEYTAAQNLYATSFTETGASAVAASLTFSHSHPNLYLWTVGAAGGSVSEDGQAHGANAKAGTKLAAASNFGATSSTTSSYVFFINGDKHLTESHRSSNSHWDENNVIKVSSSSH